MSTILKALRRLEDEKTAPVGRRPLREEVADSAGAPRSRRGAWLLALGGLLGGVAAGVALLVLWPRDVTVPPSSTPLVRAPSRPPQVAPPEREVAAGQLSAEALASPVKVVERPKPKPLVVDEPPPAAFAAEPERSPARDLAANRSAPSVAGPPPAAGSAAVQGAPSTGSRDLREPSYAELEEIGRRLAEVPPPVAAGIRIEQTLWHPQPDRRIAVLTLDGGDAPVRVHEGDTIRELLVSEIEPSGVVFSYRGERSRLGLGEAP